MFNKLIISLLLPCLIFHQVISQAYPFGGPSASSSPEAVERECGCTKQNIWLDIVVVVDNSKSMTQEGISTIEATLLSVVHEFTLNPNGGYASRIGLVSFNANARKVAGLRNFTSFASFQNTLQSIDMDPINSGVNILSGLQAAVDLLGEVPSNPNRRTAIILFTSAYNNANYDDPIAMAGQLKDDNIKLITVAFVERMGASDVLKVRELAYPGFALNNTQPDIIEQIFDKFCQTNCFCKGNWMQFRQSFDDQYSRGYGLCLYYSAIPSGWTPAQMACQGEAPNAYLVTEFTRTKHDFNVDFVRNQSMNRNYDFHIGLSIENGQYYWEQPNGQPKIPADSVGYTEWGHGYPRASQGSCIRNANMIGTFDSWINEDCWSTPKLYICQANSCDTDNYCQ